MLKRERLDLIMKMVTEQNFIAVSDLAKTMNVSEMTIRRDLDELSKAGKVIRLHGGVQALSLQMKTEQNFHEKGKFTSLKRRRLQQLLPV